MAKNQFHKLVEQLLFCLNPTFLPKNDGFMIGVPLLNPFFLKGTPIFKLNSQNNHQIFL